MLVEQPIVAGEHKSQFIKFQMGRYYDAIDLTAMQVNIVFLSPAGNRGISEAVNTEYSDDAIRFGWLVPYAACPEKGKLYFAVEFVGADYTLKTTAGCTQVLDSISDRDIVPEPVEQEWYIVLQANVATLMQEAQRALGKVEGIFNALGTPMTAGTAAEMVEESAIYVYTGSEPNYEYGYWYYHDGTGWVPGSEYASTALVTDSTLSKAGQAADAEAVSVALAEKADKENTPGIAAPEESDADLYICDSQGNVIAEIVDGHIRTKNFDSSDIDTETDTTLTEEGKPADAKATGDRITAVEEELSGIDTESPVKDASPADADLYICDSSGNVVGEFINGHIRTKKFDSADMEGLPEDVSVLQEDVSELQSALESATTGVLYRNKEVTDGVYAICRWHQPNISSKQFCLLVSGDIHADEVRMQSIVEYFNAVNAFDAGIMLGDIVGNDWRNSATFYTNAIKNVNKPWLTVIGNHDSGSGGESATKETAYTNIEDLVAKFYTPNLQYADLASGEYVTGNSYYYKDFTSQKIRLIVLNQYEYPPDYDDANNTFVYLRGYECYSQAQITWLCNVLLNTPTDYGVIIALHSYPAWMLIDSGNLFTSSTISSTNTPRLISYSTNGFILEEIVNAFISGTSINAEFAYTVSGSFGSGVTVDADFSSRGTGEFITYIGGHWHMPVVSSTHKYGQKMFTVPCASLGSAQQGDTPRFASTRSEDNFCALAVDRDLRTVKLLQIGAHFTKDGVDRVIGNYVYGGAS